MDYITGSLPPSEEEKCSKRHEKIIFVKRLEELRKCPSAFIEEVFGIKLLPYQKMMVDEMSKYKISPRNQHKKYYIYLSLLCYFIEMKDDEYITIASSDKIEKLNKEEFGKYLENYWK